MSYRPPQRTAAREATRQPRWLSALLVATLAVTLGAIGLIGWPQPAVPASDPELEAEPLTAAATAPATVETESPVAAEEVIPFEVGATTERRLSRCEPASVPSDEGEDPPVLQLPGRLPPLRDPSREAAQRAERALQRDIERARAEAIAIGDRMARDLEHFVSDIQTLPRAEQRRYARNVHAHFDWPSADRLAVLRAKLPAEERDALQVVTYKRIEPLIWRLNTLAGED